MLARLLILFVVAGAAEVGIAAASGRPLNQAAQFVLWVGIAVVLALRAPLPRRHEHRRH